MNSAVPQQLMKLSLRRWSTFTPPYHATHAAQYGLFLLRRLHRSTKQGRLRARIACGARSGWLPDWWPLRWARANKTLSFTSSKERRLRLGNSGEHSATVRAEVFLHVPSRLAHQELNPSTAHLCLWVVVRSTPEPIVVNLPDCFWTPTDPDR